MVGQASDRWRTREETRRQDWLRDGVLSGFAATFAMTVVLAAAYGLGRAVGDEDGNRLERWFWALTHNPVTRTTEDAVVFAIALNLLMGLALALVYGRFVEPILGGPGWRKGVLFSLAPWVFSVVAFLPVMGGGFLGEDIDAGPLPILGNLILHLVYGAVLGSVYGIALEAGLDDTEAERANAAGAERGGAIGVAIGTLVGIAAGWAVGSGLDDGDSRGVITLAGALAGAAIGALIGSFFGMGRIERPS